MTTLSPKAVTRTTLAYERALARWDTLTNVSDTPINREETIEAIESAICGLFDLPDSPVRERRLNRLYQLERSFNSFCAPDGDEEESQ